MMKNYTANSIAKYFAEEIPATPLGGVLKNQGVDLDHNSIIMELEYVPKSQKGKKFKITVEELVP